MNNSDSADLRALNDRAYWLHRLKGVPSTCLFRQGRGAPGGGREQVQRSFGGEALERLERLTAGGPFLLYVAVTAALSLCIRRYTGAETVVIGSPARAGRDGALDGEGRPNTVAVAIDLDESRSFQELLGGVRQELLAAYARQSYPHRRLLADLGRVDDSGAALYPVSLRSAALHGEHVDAGEELAISLERGPDGLVVTAGFDPAVLTRAEAGRFVDHLLHGLRAALADPQARVRGLGVLSPAELERERELAGVGRPAPPVFTPLPAQFAERVGEAPEAVALVDDTGEVGYGELARRVAALAGALQRRGVTRGACVAVTSESAAEMITGLLAVMAIGAVYVPIDPDALQGALETILADCRPAVVLTGTSRAARFAGSSAALLLFHGEEDGAAGPAQEVAVELADAAYLIYTSGSTGRPNGVVVEHGALANLLDAAREAFCVDERSRVYQLASFTFDASLLEIGMALTSGAALVLSGGQSRRSALELANLACRHGVTTIVATPSLLAVLPEDELPRVHTISSGGEPLSREILHRYAARTRLLNCYGPTEATIFATFEVCSDEPSVGLPIAGVEAHVLDARLEPVPQGAVGEVYLSGLGLARGYLDRPALTAERFLPSPFTPGQRLYKTGDRARRRDDGRIELVGRADHQVKLFGRRLELGEVEAALLEHPEVERAVARLWTRAGGQPALVAHVVVRSGRGATTGAELRAHLERHLPAFMVPAIVAVEDSLPTLANGKVDRRGLPDPVEHDARDRDFIAPRGDTEAALARIWSVTLGVERVDARDNFFELGGRSLHATQVASMISKELRVEIPLESIFNEPTLTGMARLIAASQPAAVAPVIAPQLREGPIPLSFSQQRLWFIEQTLPPGAEALYNGPIPVRMEGELDVAALTASFAAILARHESLRTAIVARDGVPYQEIAAAVPFELPVVDLRHESEDRRRALAEAYIDEDARRPFDLTRAPFLRACLLRLGEREHLLALTIHHIVFDVWSLGVLMAELRALYSSVQRGVPSPLPPLPIQFADFALWQRETLRGPVLERQLGYWRRQLDGAQELQLPVRRAPKERRTYRGMIESFTVPADVTERLQRLSDGEHATLFMTLLAGFKALLHRYTAQEDLVVSSPIANRNRSELEGLIGFFVNSLVLRTDLSGSPSFRELVRRVREVALGAWENQDIPFERLVGELQPERDVRKNPLFRAAFSLQNPPEALAELPGLRFTPWPVHSRTSKFDLVVALLETDDGLIGDFEFCSDHFDPEDIHDMIAEFRAVLAAAAEDPDRPLLELGARQERPARPREDYSVESFDL